MKISKKITIAIDGHSSCGKSTLAQDLAKKLEYTFVDSGAMYRAVTLHAIRDNFIQNGRVDEEKLEKAISEIEIQFESINGVQHIFLNNKDVTDEIRLPNVSSNVSIVAKLKPVRKKLV